MDVGTMTDRELLVVLVDNVKRIQKDQEILSKKIQQIELEVLEVRTKFKIYAAIIGLVSSIGSAVATTIIVNLINS